MPRYFFDINDGEKESRDDIGYELPDAEAARRAAIEVLPDIARDVLPDGDRRDFTSSVRTEEGQTIFQAKLSLVAEWVSANDP